MIALNKCQEILNSSKKHFTKEETQMIRECLYKLADLAIQE